MKTFLDSLYYIGVIAAFVAVARLLTSCTLTVAPDGSQQWSIDGEQAARAIIIYTK